MTHDDLVERAARWLAAKGCGVVITDMSSGAAETPDAIGWKGSLSTLIECKASRADFLADGHKRFRRYTDHVMGERRYFMAPVGLLRGDEMPTGWGLLEVTPRGGVIVAREADEQQTSRRYEVLLLTSALRRMVLADGVRGIHCRTYKIENARSARRATVGAAP